MNCPNAAQNRTAGAHKLDPIPLRLDDGLTIAVSPTLSAITTYVLLEQEAWFEKEIGFLRRFLKPGMTVIDVGANQGVYSLPLARLVGSTGRVFSYEPGSEARSLLEYSRNLNGLRNLEIVNAALSDAAGEGNLAFAWSSELRALGSAATGESVRITTLDLEDTAQGWSSPDFIKIDAEGEEERIIVGARAFFATHSPLVMFEIKAGDKVNEQLLALFPTIGYRVFRQLAGAPVLVPADARQPLDGYELNLFAAKPDRVSALSQQGLLADAIPSWAPDENHRQNAALFWRRQEFASLANMSDWDSTPGDPEYKNGLVAYATWRALDEPVATRCAALAYALRSLRSACASAYTVGRASTLARFAWEWGARSESVVALKHLVNVLQNTRVEIKEPFWPASSRFDSIAPGDQPGNWFAASAAEQFERTFSFSSVFSGASPVLAWLCSQPCAGAEMERRRTLIAARAGQQPRVPERLCRAGADHLNADVWRAGMVPGTVVEA
jgi:FkbM family methyltransferase